MVRCLSKRGGVAVVAAAALSAGAGVVEAATTVDMADLYPECRGVPEYIADGYCDSFGDDTNNVEECGFDGGDCCICTCVDATYECADNLSNYNCNDTSAACYEEPGPTPSPVAVSEDADTTADNSAPLSGVTSTTVTAAGAFVVTVLCGGFAVAVGW